MWGTHLLGNGIMVFSSDSLSEIVRIGMHMHMSVATYHEKQGTQAQEWLPHRIRSPFTRLDASSFLLCDNLVLDLLVRGPRQNLLLHQFIFPRVRSSFDDLFRKGIANPG